MFRVNIAMWQLKLKLRYWQKLRVLVKIIEIKTRNKHGQDKKVGKV